jgi:hypothetical protein
MANIISDVPCDDRDYIDVKAVEKWLKATQKTPPVAKESFHWLWRLYRLILQWRII